GYRLENNIVQGLNTASIGFYVINSGTGYNKIYHNDFTNLKYGIQVNSNNQGLQLKCNRFYNIKIRDISVNGSIANPQGTCTNIKSPSNNIFSHWPGYDIWVKDPLNLALIEDYRYYTDVTEPYTYTPNIDLFECTNLTGPFIYDNSCPLKPAGTIQELLYTINNSSSMISTLKNQIDGGNTQTLLDKVYSNSPPGQIKNELLNKILSDTILIATVKRTNPLPAGIVKEVVVANSQVTNKVMAAILTRTESLPSGTLSEIYDVQTGVSAQMQLEEQIAYYTHEKGDATNELIQRYLGDTTIVSGLDSLETFLLSQPDRESQHLLVQTYLENNKCAEAAALLAQLPQDNYEDINFVGLHNLLAGLCSSGLTIYDIDSTQETIIREIAASNTYTAAQALAILSTVFGDTIEETFEEVPPFDTATISGVLYESQQCGGLPIAGEKIYLCNETGNIIYTVKPAITGNDGAFRFEKFYLVFLDTTELYTINTAGGFTIENAGFKTLREWYDASPLELRLSKVSKIWADFYAGADSLGARGTAIDLNGNIYVAGTEMHNNGDIVVIKYAPAGNRLWIKTYNGTGNGYDIASDIVVDKQNNIYVVGSSTGAGANYDIVILKYTSAGVLQWVKRYNGAANGADQAKALAIDLSNNVYIAGSTFGSNGNSNIVTLKYNKNGKLQWLRTYNENGNGYASDIKIDKSNNVIVTGYGIDYITIKYNSYGAQLWVKQYNSGFNDQSAALTIDNNNNIYITGFGYDAATVKYAPNGIQQWVAHTAGLANDITSDNAGNIYVAGNANTDAFVVKYSTAGAVQWKKTYTSAYYNGVDAFQAITTDKNNDVYATGWSATAPYAVKYFDHFTAKFDAAGTLKWSELLHGDYHTQNMGNDIVVSENLNVYVTGTLHTGGLINMT
ncbi:MAG: hypothetical protein HY738_22505, partial [Bacteroidia bacterium]|nr:hypothetical protein [Bacteroidia bacterium]